MEVQESDAVQLYLTQMGDVPLLSRQAELQVARRIEISRRRYRLDCCLRIFCSMPPWRYCKRWRRATCGPTAPSISPSPMRNRGSGCGHYRRQSAHAPRTAGAESAGFLDCAG